MGSGIIILGIIICVGVLIYAINGLNRVNSFQKKINKQSENEINAVKNLDPSQLRSKESMDNLQNWLMTHIKPQLKSPTSAVLCSPSEMSIQGPDDNGKFKISGYVNSQNSFGAMLRTNFYATAHYNPVSGGWIVEKVTLI